MSPTESGKSFSMQAAGNFTFTTIVIASNVKLLISAYEIAWPLIILVLGSIALYFGGFWFLTWYSPEADDFGIFTELFTNVEVYAALTFVMCSYILIDNGMRFANIEMTQLWE